jgi:hypothetical protein
MPSDLIRAEDIAATWDTIKFANGEEYMDGLFGEHGPSVYKWLADHIIITWADPVTFLTGLAIGLKLGEARRDG